MTLQAFKVISQGAYAPDVAERRGVSTWSKAQTVLAHDAKSAIARVTISEPDATEIAVASVRPPRWSELPLQAFEIHRTKRAAAVSADGWRERGLLARVFPRSVRAGGAETGVIAVVVRRKA